MFFVYSTLTLGMASGEEAFWTKFDGFCRTTGGGKADANIHFGMTKKECKEICLESTSCHAYFYNGEKSKCKLFPYSSKDVIVAGSGPDHPGFCRIKTETDGLIAAQMRPRIVGSKKCGRTETANQNDCDLRCSRNPDGVKFKLDCVQVSSTAKNCDEKLGSLWELQKQAAGDEKAFASCCTCRLPEETGPDKSEETDKCLHNGKWKKITCPVITALVVNCDLMPDAEGFVTKQQTFDALVATGISEAAAEATTNGNFDHLAQKKINIFAMNTVRPDNSPSLPWKGEFWPVADQANHRLGALEHFRSTGIRDGDKPNQKLLDQFLDHANEDGVFTLRDTLMAIADYDVEAPHCESAEKCSNDVNEGSRPKSCAPGDSVVLKFNSDGTPDMLEIRTDKCFANLHGSITLMHTEFGTPHNPNEADPNEAVLTRDEMEGLWLRGDYPKGFAARRAAKKHEEGLNFKPASVSSPTGRPTGEISEIIPATGDRIQDLFSSAFQDIFG